MRSVCRAHDANRQSTASPTVTSNLRQGFYQAVKNLAGKHWAEAFAKYPELRAYTKS